MALRIEQRLVLVLPVQLDERRRLLAERRGGDERVVDERAAAPLRVDVAADDQRRSTFGRPHRTPPARGLCLAGADEIGRRAAAHEQADGLDEHRLARPGFAGQDVQTRLEFDLDRIDDGEVLNAKEAKHREGLLAESP